MRCIQKLTIVLLSISVLIMGEIASAQPLIVSFGCNNTEPYALLEGEQLVGGIIKDMMDELAKELGREVRYMDVPRKRIEPYLLSGKLHICPIFNPAWGKDSAQYDWSIPLFQESNLFVVSAKRAFPVKTFDDLNGKRLGTILGYCYPGLMEKFDRQEIKRDDVTSLEQNFKKLEAGRIDCLIDSNILIDYYLKKHDAYDKFVIAEKVASTHDIQSMFSKQIPISIDRINAAFQQLKESGKIAEILDKYK